MNNQNDMFNQPMNNQNATGMVPLKKKINPILIAIPVVALIAIIVIIVANSSSYKTPIKNYAKGAEKGDYKLMMKAYPKEIRDEELKDVTDEELEKQGKYLVEQYKETYGDNYKFKLEFKDKEEVDKDKLDEFNEYFKEEYNANRKVTKIYRLTVKLTVKGSKKNDDEESVFYVGKIDDKWYLLDD